MSAIAGLLRLDGVNVDAADLERMVMALLPHGPDKQQIWTHQELGLAHCLMRFTPEDYFEKQPVTDKGNGTAMVFAGRIDNRSELVERLELPKSDVISDSQLAQLAYLKWNTKAFPLVIGDWVWAIWSQNKKQLQLVRDPQGYSRSLHYSLQANFFAFSTAPKGLMALPGMPRKMNRAALADFLILNHDDMTSTLYEGVKRLAPGHLLTFDTVSCAIEVKRYWQINTEQRISYKKEQDYVDHFKQLFEQVVDSQLRTCHAVGAFMSGGIDSSAVATSAAKLLARQGKNLSSYTSIPQRDFDGPTPWGRYNDETPLVNAIAKMTPNLTPHFVASEGLDQLSGIDNYLEQAEAPIRNPDNRVWMETIMRTAAANNERVLLTGQQGNYTISYEGNWSLAPWFKSFNWSKLLHGIKQLNGYRGRDLSFIVKNQIAKPLLPQWLYRMLVECFTEHHSIWSANCLINPEFANQIKVALRANEAGFSPYWQFPVCSREVRKLSLVALNFSGDLHESWRASFGTELRDPTADRRIIEYCLAIPDEQYLNRKGLRWLATRAFAEQLPKAVLHNNLRGTQDPGWYLRMQQSKRELELEYERLVQNTTAQQVLDLPRMRQLLNDWPDNSANWNSKQIIGRYRLGLSRAIMVGRYIRWFEGDKR
ncbi:asparagine synthetase B family protein [Planctobacterium marinum]|uniref:asparagine synthase (glutamine-hydrolyzing) n=1 Tax=Planctobacterium marinum TaxID=1631968 RepID=A0AA48HMP0_9ALTE|nr:asparagine synthetase B [Planctobacterium marinum]